jgi:hypothetical protein
MSTVATAASVGFASRAIGALERYFFRPGGELGIAFTRVALFVGVYLSYTRLPFGHGGVEAWLASVSPTAYAPKGIVQLFWAEPPPAAFVEFMLVVAQASTIMAIVGLLTRPAMVASVISVWFLHGLGYSFVFGWSHPHNVVILAGLAFMFGRAGDRLSLDAVICRWRGQSPPPERVQDGTYMWPLLLGQAATALFYFGAGFAKLVGREYGFELTWIFSDSLRNMLIQPWFVDDLPLPWYVALAASHPLLWQLTAFGHLVCQFTPLLACFAIHRPYVRLAEGLVFVAGVILLGLFMGFWNEQWLFLLAFFIDWDFFFGGIGWLRRGPAPGSGLPVRRAAANRSGARLAFARSAVLLWAVAFLAFFVATFTLRLGWTHRFYPFSNLDFFATPYALEPYGEHRDWHANLGEISLITDEGETFIQQAREYLVMRYRGWGKREIDASLDQKRGLAIAAAGAELQRATWRILGTRETLMPAEGSIREVRYWGATVVFPAYPAPPGWARVFHGLLGAYDVATGTVRVAHGEFVPEGRTGECRRVDMVIGGFARPAVRVSYVPNPRTLARPAERTLLAGRFELLDRDADGNVRGRFVPEPGQQLPWRAALMIEVSEAGKPAMWPFMGPVATW